MKIFRNLFYPADTNGTFFWRRMQAIYNTYCVAEQYGIKNSILEIPIADPNYYKGVSTVTIQRWISDWNHNFFFKFLYPICHQVGAWIIYEIDDAMHYKDIQIFNRGRTAYANEKTQKNITEMMNASDFITVTTNYLKNYYIERYGVNKDKFIVIPNLMAKWWFGSKFDPEKKAKQFSEHKNKPRIGIVSSLSHYNCDNKRRTKDNKEVNLVKDAEGEEKWVDQDGNTVKFEDTLAITDDLDEILDVIEETINDFQWVFIGYYPKRFKKYVDEKKIEINHGSVILNYPNLINSLNLQAIVAPIKKCIFNFSKSPIKFLESCAIGVILYATRCEPYVNYMKDSQMFEDIKDLKQKLFNLKNMGVNLYKKILITNWKWLNDKHEDGDFSLNSYWVENNMKIYLKLFRLPQRGMSLSLKDVIKTSKCMEEKEKKSLIFSSEKDDLRLYGRLVTKGQ